MLEHRRKDKLLVDVFDSLKKVDLSNVSYLREENLNEPPPALKALAKKVGKSLKDAERYYQEVKKQVMAKGKKAAKDLTDKDYSYIMGVVKKRLGLPVKPVKASTTKKPEVMKEQRTIGDKYKQQVRSLVQQARTIGKTGVAEITDYVIMALPEEAFDTWEGARAEIERIVNDIVMEKVSEETYTVIAKGISDKPIADRIAREKSGKVLADEDDGDKFMVVTVKETRLSDEVRKELNQLYMKLHNLVNQGIQKGREPLQSKISSLEKKALESGMTQDELTKLSETAKGELYADEDCRDAFEKELDEAFGKEKWSLNGSKWSDVWVLSQLPEVMEIPVMDVETADTQLGIARVTNKFNVETDGFNRWVEPTPEKIEIEKFDKPKPEESTAKVKDYRDLAERLYIVNFLLKKKEDELSEKQKLFIKDTLAIELTEDERNSVYQNYQELIKA